MRLQQLVPITNWVETAEKLAYPDIVQVLKRESEVDPIWFSKSRKQRIRQLVTEILTLKLIDASSGRWDPSNFIGRDHSVLITNSINRLTLSATNIHKQLVVDVENKIDFSDNQSAK